MKHFRTYQLAKDFYKAIRGLRFGDPVLCDQACRASMSIVLNLAEGYGKRTEADRRRFYYHAMGSLREVQACLDLVNAHSELTIADQLGACIYRLIQRPGRLL